MHPTAFERVQGRFHKRVIHADGSDLNLKFLDPQLLFQFRLDGMPSLRAQTANALVGVIAGKSCQIHAGNRAQKPCRLPFFFHGSARDLRLSAALDRAAVDAYFAHPIQIERDAVIPEQRPPGENRNRIVLRLMACHAPKPVVFDWHEKLSAAYPLPSNCTADVAKDEFRFRLDTAALHGYATARFLPQGEVMFTPHSLNIALFMMITSAICWGSWANTYKGV